MVQTINMFTQPEVCVISDMHFGVHQNSPLWHETALKWVAWLSKELRNRGIRDIIIAGDVFHNRNDIAVNTLNVVATIMTELSDFDIKILVGNHDAFYKDRSDVNSISIFNGWKNITIYTEPTTVDYMGRKLLFCPWGTTIDQMPASDIIFGHFEIASFKMNNFKVCDHGFSTDELFKKTRLVMTGHFHLREERVYDEGAVIYLGSPYELDWSDKDSVKGIYILDLRSAQYSFLENTLSPKHVEIKLTDLIRAKNLNGLKDSIKGNIVRFIIDKEIESDKVDILAKKLNSFQPLTFSIEYFCFSQVEQVVDLQTDLGVDTAKTIDDFIQAMDVKHKTKVYDYVMELYTKAKQ